MEKILLDYLDEREAIICIKGIHDNEIISEIANITEKIQDKKLYNYSKNELIDLESKEKVRNYETLYEVLDDLFVQGMKKNPLFLILSCPYEELNDFKVIKYFEEIIETKKINPKYKLTIFVINDIFPNGLEAISKEITYEKELKESLEELVKSFAQINNLELHQDDVKKVVYYLKDELNKFSKAKDKK